MQTTRGIRFAQRNVRRNVGDVVVLASPPRDPIRSSTTSGDASVRCTRAAPRRLLLPRSSKYGGETDWIYNATAWCMWWRVSAAGLRLHAVGRGRERRAAGRLGLRGRCGGWCAPSPLYIEEWAPTLAPPPSLGRRPRREEWGASSPLLLEAPLGFPLVWPAGPYGALCPWPNAARALPHRPMPPPDRWDHVGPPPQCSRSFRYNTD